MAARASFLAMILAPAAMAIGCGIDGSLTAGSPDSGVESAESGLRDGAGDGGSSDASTLDSSANDASGLEAGFPEAAPVCDSGSTLGGPCSGASGCCPPLTCTASMTCQWSCTENSTCTTGTDCCPGTYCGPGHSCTCIPDNMPCSNDIQCCSNIMGGGCDNHGDAGRVCSNN